SMAKKRASASSRGEATYPTYGYSHSLKIAAAVKEFGGDRVVVPRSVIANHLGLGDSSSAFYGMVASAKCFGMVDGARELGLTEDGQRYFFPASEDEHRAAELQFFVSPPAFALLAGRFDGNSL